MTIPKVTFNPTVTIIHFNNYNRDVTVQLSSNHQLLHNDDNNIPIHGSTAMITHAAYTSTTSTRSYKTLTEEINEILIKIQTNPNNPAHYIHAGVLYSCQGNQQESISICEQGLRYFSSSMEDRLVLQQQLYMAKERLERRVDFLYQCPYEIVCNIISQLDSKSAMQCIDVARSWRLKVLNYTDIWKEFVLHSGISTAGKKKKKTTQLLSIISIHVEELLIHARPEKIKRYLGLLKEHNFLNLQSLAIYDTGDGTINAEISLKKMLYSVLPLFSNTLTKLELTSRSFIDVSLGRILLLCPKLTTIKLNIYSLDGHVVDNRDIPSTRTELTRLDLVLHFPNHVGSFRLVLHILLPWMPKLRYFRIFYNAKYTIDNEDIMGVIRNQCQDLTYIRTGAFTDDNMEEWLDKHHNDDEADVDDDEQIPPRHERAAIATTTNTTTDSDVNNGGLECLVLHNIRTARHIRTRLKQSQHTLRKLSLTLSIADMHPQMLEWEALTDFTMHRLTSFHLSCSNKSRHICWHLGAILRCFPVLKQLSLCDAKIDMYYPEMKNIMNAIVEKTRLTRLEFSKFEVNVDEFFDWLMYQFMLVSQQEEGGEGAGLKVIRIVQCYGFTKSAMQHVTRMKSLKEFTMIASDQIISETDVEEFTKLLLMEPASSLETLELGNVPITDQAVENIIDCQWHKNLLNTVVLRHVHGLSRQSMKLLETHIENLSIIV